MNLALQDPFTVAKEYPDTLINSLQFGHAVHIQFNAKGDYLASGLSDGTIVIYDLASYAIVCVLQRHGHVRPITSLTWSKCGRYLLSSSQDWSCILWDLSLANTKSVHGNPALLRRVQFDGPIWQACLHPRNPFMFVASLFEDDPVCVDVEKDTVITRLSTVPLEKKKTDIPTVAASEDDAGSSKDTDKDEENNKVELQKKAVTKQSTLAMVFSTTGDYILAGTSKGWVNVIRTDTAEMVHSTKIANSNIKSLSMSLNGRKLAVNSSDRIIRQVGLPDMINDDDPNTWELEVEHKYQDVVNRLQWNTVTFNHNSEFLVASTFGQSSQDLYLWETSMGSLVKILEGSHEELIDVKWNYNKCMIGSTGLDSGTIYLWSVQFPSKWSALAPDFVEIEENEDYEEKEDEFDIIAETDLMKKRMEEEDTNVDICTMEETDVRGFETRIDSFVIPINYESAVI